MLLPKIRKWRETVCTEESYFGSWNHMPNADPLWTEKKTERSGNAKNENRTQKRNKKPFAMFVYIVLSAMNDVVCMADLARIEKFRLQSDIVSKHRTIQYSLFDMRVSVMHFFPHSLLPSLSIYFVYLTFLSIIIPSMY